VIKRAGVALVVLLAVGAFGLYRWVSAMPQARAFGVPPRTAWAPKGVRQASPRDDSAVIPLPDAFHTMHVGVQNTDEIWGVAAPMVRFQWTAEESMYVAEGPTYDNQGNLYFSPYNPKEDVSLVSLEGETGKRRWAIPGRGAGGGAPLILNDPEQPGEQLIYHGTYTQAMALRPNGTVVWSVPTGLTLPERREGERDFTHNWGMNYQPQLDAVFGVTMDGWVYAHDRRSGRPILRAPFHIPGAPAPINFRLPFWISTPANRETDRVFGRTIDGQGLFTAITEVIFGNGFQIANFYAIDPNSGRLFIAATAPDEQDGAADGVSRNGAVWALEVVGAPPDQYEIRPAGFYPFSGGTGSTPTVSLSSDRLLLSDDNGNVIALDTDLKELWRVNVGGQVAASIAVSADNREIYTVTQFAIVKLIDRGNSADVAWRATLDVYPGFDNFNALTPTITANGIAVNIGAGRGIGARQLMHKVGAALLDRETGAIRSFAEGREESIAVTSIGPDGGFYMANSPVRRAVSRGLLGDQVPPIVGGIQRYQPIRLDILVRDATCAGAARARNAATVPPSEVAAHRDDARQIGILIDQSRIALPRAVTDGDLTAAAAAEIGNGLDESSTALGSADLSRAAAALQQLCDRAWNE
jgi:outer membrane protein assembly factor BamB